MNIDQNLHFPGPDRTAGQPRQRQDGAPHHTLAHPAAADGFMDAGRIPAPCPRVRVRRGKALPARFSSGMRRSC